MPVIDHEVHASTKQGADSRYGCWNRVRTWDKYPVKDGYRELYNESDEMLAVQRWTDAQDVMSKECRFDMSLTDPKCEGCRHRGGGEVYAAEVKWKAEGRNEP